MSIAWKLRAAILLHVAVLGAALTFVIHTTRRSIEVEHARDDLVWLAGAGDMPLPRADSAADTLSQLRLEVAQARVATQVLSDASRAAMTRELAAADERTRAAERSAWGVIIAALVMSALLATFIAGAIVVPIGRLARGTREISAGHFGHRLDANGADGDELVAVARDFNAMAARLDELDRLKQEFVSNVSHDLKTPLSSMQESNAALLDGLAGPLTIPQRRLLAHSQDSGRRLSSMVGKLLELSRLEARRAPELQEVDVVELAQRAVSRFSGATRHAPSVTLAVPETPLLLRGDGEGLERVLDNLLENACKFSPPEGLVQVTLRESPEDQGVLISVADEGPGIPDADKVRVFDRFYQTGVGRESRTRGVGLGLSICKLLVEEHEGRIWVSDNVPHGAVVSVLLPRAHRSTPRHS